MNTNETASRRPLDVYFEFENEIDDFDAAVTALLRLGRRQIIKRYLSEENMERFSHGQTWMHHTDTEAGPGRMQSMSSGWEIKFDDLISGDLSLIRKNIGKVIEDMERQFVGMMYNTVSAACERTGNVVDVKMAGSFASGFLEMLSKIEFVVGRDGQVKMPEIHGGPDMHRIISELENQPPEFQEKVERLKAEKIAVAFERENERKARFKRYPE